MPHARITRCRQPLIVLTHILNRGIVPCDHLGLIRRSIIDNDNLMGLNSLIQHAFNCLPQKLRLFVTGNDHADEIQELLLNDGAFCTTRRDVSNIVTPLAVVLRDYDSSELFTRTEG